MRRPELKPGFDFREDLDIQWVGHPNWYFRISKHSLPFLKTAHTSATFFADEFPPDESLSDYVLKPLYSFAGLGVDMDPTREKLAALTEPHSLDSATQSDLRGVRPDGRRPSLEG